MTRKMITLPLVAGVLIGAIIVMAGVKTVEVTNTLEFCISCHEMESTVYQEYLKSPHFKTESGVGAICADCHVPKEWSLKLLTKTLATKDLFHHIIGTVDTPEKFEEHRLTMAERVWAKMKETDSRECRNCHHNKQMDFHKMSRRAQEKMEPGLEKGKTCIDCHKGIAHKLPEEDD